MDSPEYKKFWEDLRAGTYQSGQFKRLTKSGAEVWLEASYIPIQNIFGTPSRVVKYATDITAQKEGFANYEGQIDAISRAMAVIEFTTNGQIVKANENFLAAMGYSIDEIRGQHHRMFVSPEEARSQEYASFWQHLGAGEYSKGEYKRIAKGGREVWLQASYNPVFDTSGRVKKIVKYAADITKTKADALNTSAQIAAIHRAMAVIEFDMNGKILDANENFLSLLGYSLQEIKGQHHSLFVSEHERQSVEYQAFWQNLRQGKYDAGQYRRFGKNAREVWIQASYNPILDMNDQPYKVVKFASDITSQMLAAGAVLESAAAITQASEEIIASGRDLAQRTESQAATVEQTAASMHEVTETVKQNAENSSEANSLSLEARQIADSGSKIMGGVTDAMRKMEASAERISDIVALIDEIAFQTNLLALNASVEAARAGEAGRGFAVVAQEVRSLAQRAGSASGDIKKLMSQSGQEVHAGSKLVAQADTALTEIVAAITKVSTIVSEISAASLEQATGLDQVNTAVANIDEMTQRNAALVEENHAAAQSMSSQARELVRIATSLRGASSSEKNVD